MKLFGKTLMEYLVPVRYYVLVCVLVVISQYYIASPLAGQYPWLLQVTQWAWELMVALAAITLVRKHNFEMKHIVVIGVLFSLIIHGLKAFVFRVFLFPYSGTFTEVWFKIFYKFFYGSALVMVIAVGLGFIFYAEKKWHLSKW